MQDTPHMLSAALGNSAACALIDPALCPGALGHRTTRQAHTLIVEGVSAPDVKAKAVLPFLVPLSDDPQDRQRQLVAFEAWALEFHAVSWLESHLRVDELALQLGQRLDVMLSDRQPALLRLSDTRILPVVHAVLSEAEHPLFFAPVSRWWYFDRQEQLQSIAGPLEPGAGQWKPPWHMQAAQESALLRAAEADAVLALLREQAWDRLQTVPRAQRHGFVSEQMRHARRWGIEATHEQALYCVIALNMGAEFSQLPAWEQALAKVRDKTLTLAQAIDSIQ